MTSSVTCTLRLVHLTDDVIGEVYLAVGTRSARSSVSDIVSETTLATRFAAQLECGPMPNVMVALFNAAKFG